MKLIIYIFIRLMTANCYRKQKSLVPFVSLSFSILLQVIPKHIVFASLLDW